MNSLLIICICLIFVSSSACSSKQNTNSLTVDKGSIISCKVISIIDGDTYDALIQGNKTIRIRMEGIDAPEKGMPFYRKSKSYLSSLCLGKKVKIKVMGVDNHKRILAYSYLEDNRELGQEMIKAGFAWHFKKYNSDVGLSDLEVTARTQRKGLWIDENPMSPWENRRLHRLGISTKDSFNIKETNR